MFAAFVYCAAVVLANLTATHFVAVPLGPFGTLQVAVGTIIFGITYTQRDRMHHRGRRFVYGVIAATAVLALVVLLGFAHLFAEPLASWAEARGWTWLGGGWRDLAATSARVYAASFLAILLAESADTEVYHRLRNRSWMVRVLRSNAVSIPLDTLLFTLIAFGGVFPWTMIVGNVAGDLAVKGVVATANAFWVPARERAACVRDDAA